MLEGDSSGETMKESIPLELSLTGDTEFEFNQPVFLSGECNCGELDAKIVASVANGVVQGTVEVGIDTFTVDAFFSHKNANTSRVWGLLIIV